MYILRAGCVLETCVPGANNRLHTPLLSVYVCFQNGAGNDTKQAGEAENKVSNGRSTAEVGTGWVSGLLGGVRFLCVLTVGM